MNPFLNKPKFSKVYFRNWQLTFSLAFAKYFLINIPFSFFDLGPWDAINPSNICLLVEKPPWSCDIKSLSMDCILLATTIVILLYEVLA